MWNNRVWNVGESNNFRAVAETISFTNWTLCTGFKVGNILILNDSNSTDYNRHQEYGVIRLDDDALTPPSPANLVIDEGLYQPPEPVPGLRVLGLQTESLTTTRFKDVDELTKALAECAALTEGWRVSLVINLADSTKHTCPLCR